MGAARDVTSLVPDARMCGSVGESRDIALRMRERLPLSLFRRSTSDCLFSPFREKEEEEGDDDAFRHEA